MNIGLTGTKGESMVARFLKGKGFSVIRRNYQCRFGEIDIIAEDNDNIIFVEVKTRKENTAIPIEEAVDFKKRKRILLTAEDYLTKSTNEKQPRFDVALVTVKQNQSDSKEIYSLKYIENAFWLLIKNKYNNSFFTWILQLIMVICTEYNLNLCGEKNVW